MSMCQAVVRSRDTCTNPPSGYVGLHFTAYQRNGKHPDSMSDSARKYGIGQTWWCISHRKVRSRVETPSREQSGHEEVIPSLVLSIKSNCQINVESEACFEWQKRWDYAARSLKPEECGCGRRGIRASVRGKEEHFSPICYATKNSPKLNTSYF